MRKRARTDLCGGRPAMVVPTATVGHAKRRYRNVGGDGAWRLSAINGVAFYQHSPLDRKWASLPLGWRAPAGGAVSVSLLQPDLVVDGLPQPLLTAQVFLDGLHRDVAEQELDLLQFPAGITA